MSKMDAKTRNALPASSFALPGERKFPINDAPHQRNAIARAAQQEKAGNLAPSTAAKIESAARRKLHGDGHWSGR